MTPLPNPERAWERPPLVDADDPAEVVRRRLGPTSAPLEILSGGLANLNVGVGADHVLRVYRRDPAAQPKEALLLRRGWRSLRVPAVFDEGDDFLLLERVAHGPLLATAEHGGAVGRALAELHQVRFDVAGHLGHDLTVVEPFPCVVSALRAHVDDLLDGPAAVLAHDLAAPLRAFLAERADRLRARAGPPVLLHGDFKASNLHWTPDGRLLVLDWEFAWAGPALMDVGQLMRWAPPDAFCEAFAASYRGGGGALPDDWRGDAAAFDLANLVGLLAPAAAGSRRALDVRRRIAETLVSAGR